MILVNALVSLVVLAQAGGIADPIHPAIPSHVETSVAARCGGKAISIRYAVDRPGPDMFSLISLADRSFHAPRLPS